jgi:hypothetical protein
MVRWALSRAFAVGVFVCVALAGCAPQAAPSRQPLNEQQRRQFVAEHNIQPLDTLNTPTSTAILQRDPAGVGCYVASQRGGGAIDYGYERTGVYGGRPADSGPVLAVLYPLDGRELLCMVINDPDLRQRTSRVAVQFDANTVTVSLDGREGLIFLEPKSQRISTAYQSIVLYDRKEPQLLDRKEP